MSKALELADRITPETDWYEFHAEPWCESAAAELRRLAEVERDRDALARHCEKLEADNSALRQQLSDAQSECVGLRATEQNLREELNAIYETEPVAWARESSIKWLGMKKGNLAKITTPMTTEKTELCSLPLIQLPERKS